MSFDLFYAFVSHINYKPHSQARLLHQGRASLLLARFLDLLLLAIQMALS